MPHFLANLTEFSISSKEAKPVENITGFFVRLIFLIKDKSVISKEATL